MDDLAKKLSELLNSPDGMQKIQAAAASFGMLGGGTSASDKSDPPPESASSPFPSLDGLGSLGDIETIQKLIPIISGLKSDNQDTILLKALRPYLQDERQQRLDESIKMMQLIKLLPLLKEKGGL